MTRFAPSRRLATVLIVGVLVASPRADQADRAQTEALARRATERLQALRAEADRLAAREKTILTELRQLEVDRQIKAEELAQIERDAAEVTANLNATDERIAGLEAEDEAARPALRARLIEMYKLGQGRYLALLLSAKDLRRVGQSSRMVGALAKLDGDRINAFQHTHDELTTAREELATRRQQLEALRRETAAAQTALARTAAARSALVQRIDGERDTNARFVGELRDAQIKLQQTLRDLAAGAETTAVGLPIRPFRGDLPWPADGTLRRRVGRTAQGRTPSRGIEILAAEGAPVRAIHDGQVAFAGSFSGFGNLVIVDHGGRTFSLYGDLLDLSVAQGTRIDRGDVVGSVGTLPAGPPGLYFELRIDGEPVDPLQWLVRR